MKRGFAKFAVGVSALALVFGVGTSLPVYHIQGLNGSAAAEGSGDGQGKGGQGGSGGQGSQGGNGSQGMKSKGQGGPGEDSDGKGPKAGNSGTAQGGKPVWAQEGIPEVELGRLNVARSPKHVLDRAYNEALSSFTPDMSAFYNQSLDQIVEALKTDFDNQTYVDSPLQNLALLKDALDGSISLPGVTNNNETLEAVFLGVASDKTVPITSETVVAVTTILGTPVTGAAAEKLAADAEAVREAVAEGHG